MIVCSWQRTPIWFLFICGLLLITDLPRAASASAPADYVKMIERFKSLHTFQANINSTTVLQPLAPGAKPRTIPNIDMIAFKSPNLFCLTNNGTMGGNSIVCDGKTEVVYSDLTQQYAIVPAPQDIVKTAFNALSGSSVLWVSDSATTISGISVKKLVGTISSRRGSKTVIFYIRQSDSLPYEVVLSATVSTSATGNGLKIIQTAVFTNEKVNKPVLSSIFKFSIPSGATKVGSIAELSGSFAGSGLQ